MIRILIYIFILLLLMSCASGKPQTYVIFPPYKIHEYRDTLNEKESFAIIDIDDPKNGTFRITGMTRGEKVNVWVASISIVLSVIAYILKK